MKVCYDKLWKLLIDKKMKKTDLICEDFGLDNGLVKKTKYETVDLSKIVLDSENAKKIKRYLRSRIRKIKQIKNFT